MTISFGGLLDETNAGSRMAVAPPRMHARVPSLGLTARFLFPPQHIDYISLFSILCAPERPLRTWQSNAAYSVTALNRISAR